MARRYDKNFLSTLFLLLLAFVWLYGCSQPVTRSESVISPPTDIVVPEKTPPQPVLPSASEPVIEEPLPVKKTQIEIRLNDNLADLPVIQGTALLRGLPELRSFYAGRNWQPAWFDGDMTNDAVPTFLAVLGKAEEEGLSSRDYHDDEIKALLNSLDSLHPDARIEAQADLDILLTDAYRAYAAHLYSGKIDPGRVSRQWPVQKSNKSKMEEILEIPSSDQMEKKLNSLSPVHLGYRQLRDLLARYRRIEATGGWPVISGGKLAPGHRNARVAMLKRRLFLSGELAAMPTRNRDLYDNLLVRAVRLFQRTHNLKEDGVVGPATLRLLNMSVKDRIDQIRLNMERWRWMPRNMDRYILVNIPAFEMRVAEKGFVVLKMRTIVGMEDNPTPSFADQLTQIEINPYWNVPNSIVQKEIIPKVKKDPTYLATQGIRIYRDWQPDAPEILPEEIDWAELIPKKFRYRMVQDPGPLNPLGQIKFLFPNNYNVYMHDTPTRHLFQRQGRTFSHGCIRLEKPIDLAEYLLKNEPGWDRKQILKKINSGEHEVIILREPIPVHIVYFTVWTAANGLTYFRDDLYEYDRLLETAILRNRGKTGGFLF
ncbi:MAG: L,D-transpeptidase family protein [Syntrophaceae bacterium]|nr:L,D-transpeptidase family protein [Syntrophaceae bacterium]